MAALERRKVSPSFPVAQQALVCLVAGHHVDDAPEARPAFEAAELHVPGDQAGSGADGHGQMSVRYEPLILNWAAVSIATVPTAPLLF